MAYVPVPRYTWIFIFRHLDGSIYRRWPPIQLTLRQMQIKIRSKNSKVHHRMRVEAHGVDIGLIWRPLW